MSQLLKLRQWFDVDSAAKQLNHFFEGEVCASDIFALALDGQLTLSVHFDNPCPAQMGTFILLDDDTIVTLDSVMLNTPSASNAHHHANRLFGKSTLTLGEFNEKKDHQLIEAIDHGYLVLSYDNMAIGHNARSVLVFDEETPHLLRGFYRLPMQWGEKAEVKRAHDLAVGTTPTEANGRNMVCHRISEPCAWVNFYLREIKNFRAAVSPTSPAS